MKKIVIILFVLVSFRGNTQGYSWEIGAGIGTAHYFGDIGSKNFNAQSGTFDAMVHNTRFNAGIFTRRRLSYPIYLQAQVNYILIEATDHFSPSAELRRRSLNFENHMAEALAMIEFHPVIIREVGGRGGLRADFNWYISTGIGILYQQPIASFNTGNTYLRPLNTEGPSQQYSIVQAVIPLSTGILLTIKGSRTSYKLHRIGFNVNYRLTFTDYLDDVSTYYPDVSVFNGNQKAITASYQGYQEDPTAPNPYPSGDQRGNPNKKDRYLTFTFTYSKILKSKQIKHWLPNKGMFK